VIPSRVLVVDDEADIRTILALILRRAGYEVVTAGDGIEALLAIERQPPDLVLLDVMMPRLDGFETLRRIRDGQATAQLPVILLSTRVQPADRIPGLDRGADDHVPKPFEPADLLARVRSLLERAGAGPSSAPRGSC